MALTQFKFQIIPKAAVLTEHGNVPEKIDHYGESDKIELSDEEFFNYWKNYPLKDFELKVQNLFPLVDEWGGVKVYGSKKSSKIEIDDEDVLVKFDVIEADYDVLKTVFDLALEYGCLFVLCESGCLLVTGDYDDLLDVLYVSKAYRYMQDPEDTLNEIRLKNIKH